MNIERLLVATFFATIPAIAYALNASPVPEPETIALLGIGAVALIIARSRKK